MELITFSTAVLFSKFVILNKRIQGKGKNSHIPHFAYGVDKLGNNFENIIIIIFFLFTELFFQLLKKVDTSHCPPSSQKFYFCPLSGHYYSFQFQIFEDTRVRKYLLHSNTHPYYDDKISYVILDIVCYTRKN